MNEKLRKKLTNLLEDEFRQDEKLMEAAFEAMRERWEDGTIIQAVSRTNAEPYRRAMKNLEKRLGLDD